MANDRPAAQDPMVAAITGSWQIGLLAGFIMLVLGLLVAFHPTTSLNVICVLIGIIVVVGGVVRLIRSLDPEDHHRAVTAILGVAMIVLGVLLIRHLHLSRVLIALLVGLVFIIQGVVDLLIGFSGEARGGRTWPLIMGFVSLAAGIVVIAVPENSVTFLAVLLGIWFVVIGLLYVVAAFVLRHELKRATAS